MVNSTVLSVSALCTMRAASPHRVSIFSVLLVLGWRVRGSLGSSEDAQRASTPTTDRESRCTVHKGGTWFAELSPVTNNSDAQDSQKLRSVCKYGVAPGLACGNE
eukprot:1196135-Prorocentrum_minimum.AAC.3